MPVVASLLVLLPMPAMMITMMVVYFDLHVATIVRDDADVVTSDDRDSSLELRPSRIGRPKPRVCRRGGAFYPQPYPKPEALNTL